MCFTKGCNGINVPTVQVNTADMASVLPTTIQENDVQCTLKIINNIDTNNTHQQNGPNKENQNISDCSILEVEKLLLNENSEKFSKITNLQCHICNKQKFTADALSEHLKTHQIERNFECIYCDSKFCTSGALSEHKKIHEPQE